MGRGIELELAVAHHGADADHAILDGERRKAGDALNVNQSRGARQAHVHRGDKALSASQDHGALDARKERHGLVDGRR